MPELTPAHVQSLCNEASLLSGVTSEHVLKILGLVVRPPSIFLISEVATYGSQILLCFDNYNYYLASHFVLHTHIFSIAERL